MAKSGPWRLAPMLMVAAAGWGLTGAPRAVADPFPPVTDGRSASATIDDLQDQGYNVRINWLTGFDTKPLSECRVTRINNPGNSPPDGDTLTTVYVDVVCPNGDDGGFEFEFGVGLG